MLASSLPTYTKNTSILKEKDTDKQSQYYTYNALSIS